MKNERLYTVLFLWLRNLSIKSVEQNSQEKVDTEKCPNLDRQILAFTTYLWTIQAYSCNCEIPGLSGYTNIQKSILANVRLLKSSAPADGRIPLVYIPICGPCSATAAYNQIAVPANCLNEQQVPINQQLSRSNVDLHPQAGSPQLLIQQETGPQQLGLRIHLSQHPSLKQVDNYQKIDNNQQRTYVQQGHQQYLNSNGIVKQVDEFQQSDNNQQRTDLLQEYVIAHRSGSGDHHRQSSESYQRIRNLLQQQLQQYAQSSGSKSYQRIAVADQVGNSQTTLHGSQAARSELDETFSSNRQQQYDTNYETSLGSGTYQSVHITNQPSSESDESVSKNSDEHVHHEHEKEKNVHYKFEYAVNDKKTGDIKRHSEERQGDVVRGEYSLVEEDGNVRTVRYYADWKSGFHAQVHNSKQKPAG